MRPSMTNQQENVKVSECARTVFCLRVRGDDSSPWGEVEHYRTRKERDRVAGMNRIWGGIRTHSFEEKKPVSELEELFA